MSDLFCGTRMRVRRWICDQESVWGNRSDLAGREASSDGGETTFQCKPPRLALPHLVQFLLRAPIPGTNIQHRENLSQRWNATVFPLNTSSYLFKSFFYTLCCFIVATFSREGGTGSPAVSTSQARKLRLSGVAWEDYPRWSVTQQPSLYWKVREELKGENTSQAI